jgi:hypothetical protein
MTMNSKSLGVWLASGSIAVLVLSVTPRFAQAQNTAATIESIANHLAPVGHPARTFVVQLAGDYAMRIGHLNQFEAFLRNRDDLICNELCKDRVTGAFYASDEKSSSPSDLLRYVFTATCFGVIRSDERMGAALAILEEQLGRHTWYLAANGLSPYDKIVIRDVIGNALKTYLQTDRIDDGKHHKLERVVRLWHATTTETRPAKANVQAISWSAVQQKAARAACSRATVDRRDAITRQPGTPQ